MSHANRLLGFPSDARLLLVNADDFGMSGAINEAVVDALAAGFVRSTSLMVPCPGASQAIQLLQEHPEIRFGVHLTVVRERDDNPWNPLSPKNKVRSLLDESGHLYCIAQLAEMPARAKVAELAIEFRAQIEAVLANGLEPTHLDWHCLLDGGCADIFDLTLGLAKEYGLAPRVMTRPRIDRVLSQGLPTVDHPVLDSFRVPTEGKTARLVLHD